MGWKTKLNAQVTGHRLPEAAGSNFKREERNRPAYIGHVRDAVLGCIALGAAVISFASDGSHSSVPVDDMVPGTLRLAVAGVASLMLALPESSLWRADGYAHC